MILYSMCKNAINGTCRSVVYKHPSTHYGNSDQLLVFIFTRIFILKQQYMPSLPIRAMRGPMVMLTSFYSDKASAGLPHYFTLLHCVHFTNILFILHGSSTYACPRRQFAKIEVMKTVILSQP